MTHIVSISAGPVTLAATLNGSATADAIWSALPIEATARTWGDEIYFPIPVSHGEEKAQEVVEVGDVGYWPPGKALCLFFGPTPASHGSEVRPASPVNMVGRIQGDATVLKKVQSGAKVRVTRQ
ncbi:MAG: hypothetical protein HYY00_05870 [Chloroflexi bacterium]|nr:hypothetical protein [Chloroflexota bacterium]